MPSARRTRLVYRVLTELRDPLILLLLGAIALTTWQGDYADSTIIGVVILLNTTVGLVQQRRAERAIAALRDLAAPAARVVRDGKPCTVTAAAVVPGDLLLLQAGDIVPADADVLDSQQLETDDSALTGESLGVGKEAGAELYAGTAVVRGRGRAVVTGTGPDSALGRIAAMVAAARPGPTPLQRRLAKLSRTLSAAAALISTVVMAVSIARGESVEEAVVAAAALAVAAAPESLPAVLTLSLALGARRMARRHAIARQLRAVETLGSVTLLATDKTGTLTQNQMVAERAWTPDGEFSIRGTGYDPRGEVLPVGTPSSGAALDRLLRDVVLCNDAAIEPDPRATAGWRPAGDPTEAALVVAACRYGLVVDSVRQEAPRVGEVPFDSTRAWMATVHPVPGSAAPAYRTVVKGAPERILAACPPDSRTVAAQQWADRRAAAGYRVLAVAEHDGEPSDEQLPNDLALVGLVAMTDPPRGGTQQVLDSLHQAGVQVVMMTGDHPSTAAAIARRVGILGEVADTSELGDRDIDTVAVFARVRPELKLSLVRRWQHAGHVVAVTGDGVNDGPALRQADIGVAIGKSGTEVARQAADLVLTDDRLETVVRAIQEGRRIQDNLRRFLRYALSGGLAEVLYMLVAWASGVVAPLTPGQILWINMLTHGLPGVALGAEPAAPDTLNRPPRHPDSPVLDRPLARQIAAAGTLIAVAAVGAELTAQAFDEDSRTASFLVLGLAQLGLAFGIRDRGTATRNWFLTATALAAMALMAAGFALPLLRGLLHTEALSGQLLVWLVLLAALPGLVIGIAQRHRTVRRERPARRSG